MFAKNLFQKCFGISFGNVWDFEFDFLEMFWKCFQNVFGHVLTLWLGMFCECFEKCENILFWKG